VPTKEDNTIQRNRKEDPPLYEKEEKKKKEGSARALGYYKRQSCGSEHGAIEFLPA
jgi:hypothetical protein